MFGCALRLLHISIFIVMFAFYIKYTWSYITYKIKDILNALTEIISIPVKPAGQLLIKIIISAVTTTTIFYLKRVTQLYYNLNNL